MHIYRKNQINLKERRKIMKKIIPKFDATVDDYGGLHLKNDDIFRRYLVSLGGDVEVVVRKKTNNANRSNQENKYYWGVVLPIVADYMGDNVEAAHNALRMIFLNDNSKKIDTIKSTSTLTVTEFEEYMSKIRIYMSMEHDVYIPKPCEVDYK